MKVFFLYLTILLTNYNNVIGQTEEQTISYLNAILPANLTNPDGPVTFNELGIRITTMVESFSKAEAQFSWLEYKNISNLLYKKVTFYTAGSSYYHTIKIMGNGVSILKNTTQMPRINYIEIRIDGQTSDETINKIMKAIRHLFKLKKVKLIDNNLF